MRAIKSVWIDVEDRLLVSSRGGGNETGWESSSNDHKVEG